MFNDDDNFIDANNTSTIGITKWVALRNYYLFFVERSKGDAEKQVITWNYFRFNTRRGRETFWKS